MGGKSFRVLLLSLFIGLSFNHAKGQSDFGGRFGLSIQFGTHFQRIGTFYQVYYFKGALQASHGGHLHFNFRNLGPKEKGLELQVHGGLIYLWGERISWERKQFSEISVMAPNRNAAGYVFKYYFDGVGTSQATGTIHVCFNRAGVAFENDLFGGFSLDDKFRTGAFLLAYQIDDFNLGIQTTMWTGKSIDGRWIEPFLSWQVWLQGPEGCAIWQDFTWDIGDER